MNKNQKIKTKRCSQAHPITPPPFCQTHRTLTRILVFRRRLLNFSFEGQLFFGMINDNFFNYLQTINNMFPQYLLLLAYIFFDA